jgi:hypothetical protein
MESGPDWVSYSTSKKKFTFKPPLGDYLDDNFSLESYEVVMAWNAEVSTDYSGSYLGVEILGNGAAEGFYQPYILDIEVIEMPAEVFIEVKKVSNDTDYLSVVLEWSTPVYYRDSVQIGRRLEETDQNLIGDLF